MRLGLSGREIHCRKANLLDESYLWKVWELADDDRLKHYEKVALMMTFDRMYIPLECLDDASEACEKFGTESYDGKRVNHWSAFASTLHELGKLKHNRHARGVCLSCTSVCDPWAEPSNDYLEHAWPIYGPKQFQEQTLNRP